MVRTDAGAVDLPPGVEHVVGDLADPPPVADVAAAALVGEAEVDDGDVVVLTGPAALSFADVADRISTVFSRAVEYDPVTPEVARSALRGGRSLAVAGGRATRAVRVDQQDAMDGVTEAIRRTTGHEPRPLEDWLDEARHVPRPAGTSPPRL
jgi:NAD(P)H dehydrogenase (quinone)